MSKAKLRTKTGCFTCRARKLKCSEDRPCCHNCSISERECTWPAPSDLYDRRHRGKVNGSSRGRDSRYLVESSPEQDNESEQALQLSTTYNRLVQSNPTMRTTIVSDQEAALFNYYVDIYLRKILLPNAHPGFYSGFRSETARLMLHCDSVKCATLACCASNKFMLSGDVRFRKMALKYYSQAVKEVNQALVSLHPDQDCPGNPLLSTVQHLYINALWGPDTVNDAPKHVAGAIQLLTLRYKNALSSNAVSSAYDRIMIESVLYQTFLLALRNPFSPSFHVDSFFLESTEALLESLTFWEVSVAANSPVLGIPVSLYRLLMDVVQLGNLPIQQSSTVGADLKTQMRSWEELVLEIEESNQIPTATVAQEYPHWDAIALYTLAGSLLLDWITELRESETLSRGTDVSPSPSPSPSYSSATDTASLSDISPPTPPPPRWQLFRALSILRRPERRDSWTRCYLSSWPTMVLGYAVDNHEDIVLVRQLLNSMRGCLGYGEIQRILGDLEVAWAKRGVGGTPECRLDWNEADEFRMGNLLSI